MNFALSGDQRWEPTIIVGHSNNLAGNAGRPLCNQPAMDRGNRRIAVACLKRAIKEEAHCPVLAK
ncbi:MAG: hypothetical protein LW689_02380 [Novosphingobium sp.]|nr:hypothetical protein [Novosphingobium sp.]